MISIVATIVQAWTWITATFGVLLRFARRTILGRFFVLVSLATTIMAVTIWFLNWLSQMFGEVITRMQAVNGTGLCGISGVMPDVNIDVAAILLNVLYIINAQSFFAAFSCCMAATLAVLAYRFVKSWIPTLGS